MGYNLVQHLKDETLKENTYNITTIIFHILTEEAILGFMFVHEILITAAMYFVQSVFAGL